MKREDCKDCICLVADTEGSWVCDERELPIEQVDSCPEGIEESNMTFDEMERIRQDID